MVINNLFLIRAASTHQEKTFFVEYHKYNQPIEDNPSMKIKDNQSIQVDHDFYIHIIFENHDSIFRILGDHEAKFELDENNNNFKYIPIHYRKRNNEYSGTEYVQLRLFNKNFFFGHDRGETRFKFEYNPTFTDGKFACLNITKISFVQNDDQERELTPYICSHNGKELLMFSEHNNLVGDFKPKANQNPKGKPYDIYNQYKGVYTNFKKCNFYAYRRRTDKDTSVEVYFEIAKPKDNNGSINLQDQNNDEHVYKKVENNDSNIEKQIENIMPVMQEVVDDMIDYIYQPIEKIDSSMDNQRENNNEAIIQKDERKISQAQQIIDENIPAIVQNIDDIIININQREERKIFTAIHIVQKVVDDMIDYIYQPIEKIDSSMDNQRENNNEAIIQKNERKISQAQQIIDENIPAIDQNIESITANIKQKDERKISQAQQIIDENIPAIDQNIKNITTNIKQKNERKISQAQQIIDENIPAIVQNIENITTNIKQKNERKISQAQQIINEKVYTIEKKIKNNGSSVGPPVKKITYSVSALVFYLVLSAFILDEDKYKRKEKLRDDAKKSSMLSVSWHD